MASLHPMHAALGHTSFVVCKSAYCFCCMLEICLSMIWNQYHTHVTRHTHEARINDRFSEDFFNPLVPEGQKG